MSFPSLYINSKENSKFLKRKNIIFKAIQVQNEYYQKDEQKIQNEAREISQNLSEEERNQRQKMPEKDIKFLHKKKKKATVSS